MMFSLRSKWIWDASFLYAAEFKETEMAWELLSTKTNNMTTNLSSGLSVI